MDKPEYIYKLLTEDQWQQSEECDQLALKPFDQPFVHLATESQIEGIAHKFFGNEKRVVVLKLKTDDLIGRLVLERNPGGENLYWHLYEGAIPCSAIADVSYIEPRS